MGTPTEAIEMIKFPVVLWSDFYMNSVGPDDIFVLIRRKSQIFSIAIIGKFIRIVL